MKKLGALIFAAVVPFTAAAADWVRILGTDSSNELIVDADSFLTRKGEGGKKYAAATFAVQNKNGRGRAFNVITFVDACEGTGGLLLIEGDKEGHKWSSLPNGKDRNRIHDAMGQAICAGHSVYGKK